MTHPQKYAFFVCTFLFLNFTACVYYHLPYTQIIAIAGVVYIVFLLFLKVLKDNKEEVASLKHCNYFLIIPLTLLNLSFCLSILLPGTLFIGGYVDGFLMDGIKYFDNLTLDKTETITESKPKIITKFEEYEEELPTRWYAPQDWVKKRIVTSMREVTETIYEDTTKEIIVPLSVHKRLFFSCITSLLMMVQFLFRIAGAYLILRIFVLVFARVLLYSKSKFSFHLPPMEIQD